MNKWLLLIVGSLLIGACGKIQEKKVESIPPFVIDLNGSVFYIMPINVTKGTQCFITSDGESFICNFVKE